VERHGPLAEKAAATLADLGYDNVHVLHGDGTRGWPAHAPYDAIIVAAGGPIIPESLKHQLKIGGRLVIPVGADPHIQELVRVTRIAQNEYPMCDLLRCSVRKDGRPRRRSRPTFSHTPVATSEEKLIKMTAEAAEPFAAIDTVDLSPCLNGSATRASITMCGILSGAETRLRARANAKSMADQATPMS